MSINFTCRNLVSGVCMVLFAAAGSFAAHYQLPPPGYVLQWHDEFDSLSLDDGRGSATWADARGPSWYMDFFANENLVGGGSAPLGLKVHEVTANKTIILRAYPTPCDKLINVQDYPIVSGKITTVKLQQDGSNYDPSRTRKFKHGYFEFRYRALLQSSMHPTLWLYALPATGQELDMLELSGCPGTSWANTYMQDKITGNCFPVGNGGWGYMRDSSYSNAGGQKVDTSFYVSNVETGFNASPKEWHTYGFLWSDSLHWYQDGNEWHYPMPSPDSYYPDSTILMIDNTISNGGWCGAIDSTVTFPMEVEVDYVRYYVLP